jgi:hypothetical protein
MSQERLEKFRCWLEEYENLWKSIQVTCASCQVQDGWISLATRIVLSELPPAKRRLVVKPVPEFLACSVSIPIGDLWHLLDSVVSKATVPDLSPGKGKYREIRLPGENHSWAEPRRISRQYEYYGLKRYCLVFEWDGNDNRHLLKSDFIERVDGRLGLKEPAFDGFTDLYKRLFPNLHFDRATPKFNVQILAPLPFELSAQLGAVTVSAPAKAFKRRVGLRFFFEPEGKSYFSKFKRDAKLGRIQPGISEWQVHVRWPQGSERGKAILYFDEEKIDEVAVARWKDALNARLAVNTFFDAGHERLKAALRLTDPNAARLFERAVIKMLTILGVNVIWYGEDDPNRPDGAGVYEVVNEKSTIYLIECTIQKARAKFSLIRERAKQLKQIVPEAEILPIVFVATDGAGDLQEASNLGITLVDSSGIESLIQFLEKGAGPEAVNQLFFSLKSNFPVTFRFP